MKKNNLFSNIIVKKIVGIVLCLAVALLSIFVVGKYATNPQSYTKTIQSIDEKKVAVTGVTTAAAVASTALATIPGDATTPIANQIMDISSYLLIVVCALVLEKALLTVLGYFAFNILIPIACAVFAISLFVKHKEFKWLSAKIAVFAVVLSLIIPVSMKISDMIYATNEIRVEDLHSKVEGIDEQDKEDKNSDKSWWDKLVDAVDKSTTKVVDKMKELVNSFIDVIALFVIAYCAIPIIVFLVAFWLIKFFFNINISLPNRNPLLGIHRNQTKQEVKDNQAEPFI